MQVLCPSCETGYEIPQLQRPRKLRCARCASEWRVLPDPEPAPAGPAEAAARPDGADVPVSGLPALGDTAMEPLAAAEAMPRSLAAPLPGQRLGGAAPSGPWTVRRGDLLIGLCWLLSITVIAAGLWALWHWRGSVGHRWPPSLRLYRLLPHGAG